MMYNKMVSVIIPAYDCEKTIDSCLNSVLNQTYKDVEVIVVNDGSKDSTIDILQEFENNHEFIKVITKDNGGASSARNLGLQFANGKYICFLDADDCLLSNALEILVDNFTDDVDMVIGSYEQYGAIRQKNILQDLICNIEELPKTFFTCGFIHPCWGRLYLKSIIKNNQIQFENFRFSEDTLFNVLYLSKIDKVKLISNVVYNYNHININSITRQVDYSAIKTYRNVHYQMYNITDSSIVDETMFSQYYNLLVKILMNNKVKYYKKKINIDMMVNDPLIKKSFLSYKGHYLVEYICKKILKKQYGICYLILLILKFRGK